jgi:hypothetical protein
VYLSWGGWFPHPDEDNISDLSYLPEYRQKELARKWLVQGRHIPHYLVRIANKLDARPAESIRIPAPLDRKVLAKTLLIPADLSLDVFRRKSEDNRPMVKQLPLLQKVREHVTLTRMIQVCTKQGNGESLVQYPPTDGIFAFIWYLARFFSGGPLNVTAYFELSDGLRALKAEQLERYALLHSFLEAQASLLVLLTGGDPAAGHRYPTHNLRVLAQRLFLSEAELNAVLCERRVIQN